MSNFDFFKKGFKNGIPIFLGYLAVSFTFGIAAKNAGISFFLRLIFVAIYRTSFLNRLQVSS